MAGNTNAQYVFSRCNALNSENIGRISTWCGIRIPVSSRPYTIRRPRIRTRASANPAIEHTAIVSNAESMAVTALLKYQSVRSVDAITERYAPIFQWLVHHDVGLVVISPSGRND